MFKYEIENVAGLCFGVLVIVASSISGAWGQESQPASQPEPTTQPSAESLAIEAEVFQNVLKQPVGGGTVADLNLPDEFVRHAADRIIRASYEQRYRIVVPDSQPSDAEPGGASAATKAEGERRGNMMRISAVGVLALGAVVSIAVLLRQKKRCGA